MNRRTFSSPWAPLASRDLSVPFWQAIAAMPPELLAAQAVGMWGVPPSGTVRASNAPT